MTNHLHRIRPVRFLAMAGRERPEAEIPGPLTSSLVIEASLSCHGL